MLFFFFISSRAVSVLMFKHHIGKHFNCEYNPENTSRPDNICPGQPRTKLAKQIDPWLYSYEGQKMEQRLAV